MSHPNERARAQDLLRQYFGYDDFRPGQWEIIESILHAHDTLVVMPTGGGKSLCYQIPALLREGTVLVISPLIALMKDQVDALHRAGVTATFINSAVSFKDIQQRMQAARSGQYKLIYVAPERLESAQFLEDIAHIPLSILAVDEAHCISEWGHDFRPSYTNIPKLFEHTKRVPVIALTATATPEVRDDITRALNLHAPRTIVRGFDRPNLRYITEASDMKMTRVLELLKQKIDGTSIVYCGSRRRVEETTQALKRSGINAEAYHAGMHEVLRTDIQEKFISGQVPVLCATSAFGMGVDKADVRRVIHTDFTLTLEAYYQEAGRAGRDGLDSDCILLYNSQDRSLQEFFIHSTYPELNTIRSVYTFLYDTMGVAKGQRSQLPLFMDNVGIAHRLNLPSASVNGVLNLLERCDIIRRGNANNQSTLHLLAPPERLREYFHQTTPERREVLEALLRGVGPEALRNAVSLDLAQLVRKYDIPFEQFHKAIRAFEYSRLMRYTPATAQGGIVLLMERLSVDALPINYDDVVKRRERAVAKLDVVERYARTNSCKRNFILEYFEAAEQKEVCGRCSSCVAPVVDEPKQSEQELYITTQIVKTVHECSERFGRVLIAQILCAQSSPKIVSYGLHRVSTYASLKHVALRDVLERVDRAVFQHYLQLSADVYPILKLREKGRLLLGDSPTKPLRLRAASAPRPQSDEPQEVLQALSLLRSELSSRNSVSAHLICTDEQMHWLARELPDSLSALQRMPGVSDFFIRRYAQDFLRAIRRAQAKDPSMTKAPEKTLSGSARASVESIQSGNSLQTTAELRGLSAGTVAAHLQEAIELGIELNVASLISSDVFFDVKKALRKNPRALLKDLRAEIGSRIDFAELRVAAALARREIQNKDA